MRPVIGLEVHIHLKTRSKLFCGCSTDYIGAVPNSNVCPVCLGLPGSLPLINARAVDLAITAGLALGGTIETASRFHRKNYFYPDLPKAYQITQYDRPLSVGGGLRIRVEGREKWVRLTRLHMEEDAGKLVHSAADGRLADASHSLADYNRAGFPLAEIVSEPDMESPQEARAYVEELRRIVRYLDVSDGDMEDGSLRVDANVSLTRPDGSLGTKVEIKNVNSLRALERALAYEIGRQRDLLEAGSVVTAETRHWDDGAGVTRSSRSKEEAHDYRYFPDPDLPPLVVSPERVEAIRAALPELPGVKRERYARDWGLSEEEIEILTERRGTAEFFEALLAEGAEPRRASNWVRTEILRIANDRGLGVESIPLAPRDLAALIRRVEEKSLSATAAKDVLARLLEGLSLERAVEAAGVASGRLTGEPLVALVRALIGREPEVAETIRSGRDPKGAKRKYLQGLLMKEVRGQADPAEVSRVLEEQLGG